MVLIWLFSPFADHRLQLVNRSHGWTFYESRIGSSDEVRLTAMKGNLRKHITLTDINGDEVALKFVEVGHSIKLIWLVTNANQIMQTAVVRLKDGSRLKFMGIIVNAVDDKAGRGTFIERNHGRWIDGGNKLVPDAMYQRTWQYNYSKDRFLKSAWTVTHEQRTPLKF